LRRDHHRQPAERPATEVAALLRLGDQADPDLAPEFRDEGQGVEDLAGLAVALHDDLQGAPVGHHADACSVAPVEPGLVK